MEVKKRLASQKEQVNLVSEMGQMQKAIERLPSLAEPVPVFVPKGGMKPLLFGSPANGIQEGLRGKARDASSREGDKMQPEKDRE